MTRLWDIFCRVIDNYGDIGVCWRLCQNLSGRGERVRLWVDDASALAWMAPAAQVSGRDAPPAAGAIQVLPWPEDSPGPGGEVDKRVGDVVIEAFGCELPQAFVTRMAAAGSTRPLCWINLEYLTAEKFAERSHGLPSPVLSGPGAGLTKHFFYPGFTAGTGGLLREPGLAQRQAAFDRDRWLAGLGLASPPMAAMPPASERARWVALFCYEPAALPALLAQLADGSTGPTRLLVCAGRATAAVQAALAASPGLAGAWERPGGPSITFLPPLSQADFDHLLWACDLNIVRGEDSLVRALWAGKPLVWQIYPQHDDVHHQKLAAFLDWLNASPLLRRWHQAWNSPASTPGGHAALPPLAALWQDPGVAAARQRLLAQPDLATQLMAFANSHAAAAA